LFIKVFFDFSKIINIRTFGLPMPHSKIIKIIVASGLLFTATGGLCGNGNHPAGSRSAGLGDASVTLRDLWAVQNNIAGLAGTDGLLAGVWAGNRYLLAELGTTGMAVAMKAKPGVLGVSFTRFGYQGYNEIKAGLAFARDLGKRFSAGLMLDYLRTAIAENYGSKSMFTFEVGFQAMLSKNVTLGAHVFNPVGVKIQKSYDERVPAVYKFGLGWKPAKDILVLAETEKYGNYKLLLRGGIEYQVAEKAMLRLGYSTLPSLSGSDNFSVASSYSFGFGLKFKKLIIDFAASVHQILGWSPTVSLIYNFKQEK
jgi:hypothetical protein